ncbi:MAG: YtfJ family protein [Pseudomonadales bacterium]|nr:YtfJ family protein [Pseudomonadales bacterium]
MKTLFDLTQLYKRFQLGFKNRLSTALTLLIISYCSHIFSLELQTSLPSLTIKSYGEIVLGDNSTEKLSNKKATFIPWSSDHLTGTVTLLQVLAASQKAADLNKRYLDQFSARFEHNTLVDSATIIVSDNIPSMLGGFVKKELKKNKLLHPRAIMVNDKKALSRQVWQLPEAMAILILLDHRGIIRYYHEGQLTPEQEQLWLLKTEQFVNQAQQ